jgi:hypothetical protein
VLRIFPFAINLESLLQSCRQGSCACFISVEPSLRRTYAWHHVIPYLDTLSKLLAGVGLKQVLLGREQIEELIRDPPPPANFPGICPKNPNLRQIISQIDKSIFQRNGLHNIPYRDTTDPEQPIPVYDGRTWPDAHDAQVLPTIEEPTGDVVDIWSRQSRETAAVQKSQTRYRDLSHDALRKFINAIKYPVEMRLLPHIIREWHRQNLPISLIDAHKIARLATRFNTVDIVLQMARPDVFGLHYDMEGLREITRGMAKRAASMIRLDDEKPFMPQDILRRTPELLGCAVAMDSKRLLQDSAVLGTQLWSFVARFNTDESFRTTKSLTDICGLAERVIASMSDTKSGRFSLDRLEIDNAHRKFPFDIKSLVIDYIPALNAFRLLIEIMRSPYRACLAALQRTDGLGKTLKDELNSFLSSSPNTHSVPIHRRDAHDSTASNIREKWDSGWRELNRALGVGLRNNIVQMSKLAEWELSLLKHNIALATSAEHTLNSTPEIYHLHLRAHSTLGALERQIAEWKGILRKEKIQVKSEFELEFVRDGQVERALKTPSTINAAAKSFTESAVGLV